VPRSSAVVRPVGNLLVKRNLSNKQLGCATRLRSKHSRDGLDLPTREVNGFWGGVCQDVLISEPVLAKNSIDCRIFFADNTRRKTESGIGGKNP